MKVVEAINLFKTISKDYSEIELGYSNREQLQHWRQKLVFIYATLADKTSEVSAGKIYQERRKDIVRAEEYKRLEDQDKESKGKARSATALNAEVANSKAYRDWTEENAKAYGRWQQFTDLQDSVKLTIDSISSHLRGIQVTDYLDPK